MALAGSLSGNLTVSEAGAAEATIAINANTGAITQFNKGQITLPKNTQVQVPFGGVGTAKIVYWRARDVAVTTTNRSVTPAINGTAGTFLLANLKSTEFMLIASENGAITEAHLTAQADFTTVVEYLVGG